VLSLVIHICNPNIWEAEAGGLQVPGQPGLRETLSSKRKKGKREGRREGGRKEGRIGKEGRMDGKKEGREEGKKEGRKGGRKERRKEGSPTRSLRLCFFLFIIGFKQL
jgi:hypothetical protein